MVKYTNEQRLQIIKIYYRNSESVAATLRALIPIFGRNSRPSRQAITSLIKKFESTCSLCDVVVSVRQRAGRSVENIAAVMASVENDPNQSIPQRAQELGIAQTTLWRILGKDLADDNTNLTEELEPMNHVKRGSNMDRYTREQRMETIKIHYKNGENFTETYREVQALFGLNEAPSRQIIMNLIKHFESVGHVDIAETPVRTGKIKSAKALTKVVERLVDSQADRMKIPNSNAEKDIANEKLSKASPAEVAKATKRGGNKKSGGIAKVPKIKIDSRGLRGCKKNVSKHKRISLTSKTTRNKN